MQSAAVRGKPCAGSSPLQGLLQGHLYCVLATFSFAFLCHSWVPLCCSWVLLLSDRNHDFSSNEYQSGSAFVRNSILRGCIDLHSTRQYVVFCELRSGAERAHFKRTFSWCLFFRNLLLSFPKQFRPRFSLILLPHWLIRCCLVLLLQLLQLQPPLPGAFPLPRGVPDEYRSYTR